MRRLARHLFTLCSAVSLAIAVAVCVLWVRSDVVTDSLWIWMPRTPSSGVEARFIAIRFTSAGGRLFLHANPRPAKHPDPAVRSHVTRHPPGVLVMAGAFGYHRRPFDWVLATGYTKAWCPHWTVLATAMMLPTWWLLSQWHRRARPRPGCCLACGYELRATPGCCPECGHTPVGADA